MSLFKYVAYSMVFLAAFACLLYSIGFWGYSVAVMVLSLGCLYLNGGLEGEKK